MTLFADFARLAERVLADDVEMARTRIAHIREDKAPGQATTLEELRALYERQFATKGRAGETP